MERLEQPDSRALPPALHYHGKASGDLGDLRRAERFSRGGRGIGDTLPLQKGPNHGPRDGEVHILGKVAGDLGYLQGIQLAHDHTDHAPAFIQERSTTIAGLHGGADLK